MSMVVLFALLSLFTFIHYEMTAHSSNARFRGPEWVSRFHLGSSVLNVTSNFLHRTSFSLGEELIDTQPEHISKSEEIEEIVVKDITSKPVQTGASIPNTPEIKIPSTPAPVTNPLIAGKSSNRENDDEIFFVDGSTEKRGTLTCHGKEVDSEIIYWRKVRGDRHYESPITPHHDLHHDRYLTFEYDHGGEHIYIMMFLIYTFIWIAYLLFDVILSGWNNVRMGMECLLVFAHATGRTVVIPPAQHLYLLRKTHKDKHETEEHDEMGFEDFFDLDILKNHLGE